MHLPLEIEIEPPTRADVRSFAKPLAAVTAIAAVLGIGAIAATASLGSSAPTAAAGLGMLQVASIPSGAIVEIDERELDRTPTYLAVSAGPHRVRLHSPGYASATYDIVVSHGEPLALTAELWLQTPRTEQVRSPLPGATIVNAGFLSNGEIALLLSLPSSTERQLWVVQRNELPERIGPARADGPLAVSPDGGLVAYLAPGQGSRSVGGRLEELWITSRTGGQGRQHWVLPSARDQSLVDLTWAPDGHHLLAVSRQQNAVGGTQSRLLWFAIDRAEPKELLVLPGEIVPGSYEWGPGGGHLAFHTLGRGRGAAKFKPPIRTRDGGLRAPVG